MHAGIPIIAKLNARNDLERIIGEARCKYSSNSSLANVKDKISLFIEITLWEKHSGKIQGLFGEKFDVQKSIF